MTRKSKSDYPSNWRAIADRVKIDAGYKCIRCGHPHDYETGYVLTVHHLDLDPQNCEWWNLVALCQRCHLVIQAKVVMEQTWMFEFSEWFKPYAAGYYAKLYGYPNHSDRAWVCENLDLLLGYVTPSIADAFLSGFDKASFPIPSRCPFWP